MKSRNSCAAGKENDWFYRPQTALPTNDEESESEEEVCEQVDFREQENSLLK